VEEGSAGAVWAKSGAVSIDTMRTGSQTSRLTPPKDDDVCATAL
jgi:hypothetical protein